MIRATAVGSGRRCKSGIGGVLRCALFELACGSCLSECVLSDLVLLLPPPGCALLLQMQSALCSVVLFCSLFAVFSGLVT